MANNGGITLNPQVLDQLIAQVSGGPHTLIGPDEDIQYHDAPDNKVILVPQGMSMEHVSDVAARKADELNKMHGFSHVTNYRPWDGAHAAMIVIKRMFGLTIGKETQTMFGSNPPEFRTINIAHNQKMEVPWGQLEIPALPGASFNFDMQNKRGSGVVFAVSVYSPKKHKQAIETFFAELDKELATNSIYRGKSLMGANELTFLNVDRFKSQEIVFSDLVRSTLDAGLFTPIEHTSSVVEAGLSTKRAILAFGPYGTGKSSLGLITAQRANAQGWTFLSAKAGKDELRPVLETAKLYEPAVVFIEDIDNYTPKASDKDGISELLDIFDGISAKDSRLIVVMTSNHIDRIPAGMLRPGRIDYVVEIAGLDRGGVERLIKAVVRHDLLSADVDYDVVYAEMVEWQPAWIRAVADRAQAFAISRSEGSLTYGLTTEDLVTSARSLKPQLDLMKNAMEGYAEDSFTKAFDSQVAATIEKAMDDWAIVDRDDDKVYELTRLPAGINWEANAD